MMCLKDTFHRCPESAPGGLWMPSSLLLLAIALFISRVPVARGMEVPPLLPSPMEVIERASAGPAELIAVISQLEPAINEIPDKQILYGYLLTLPELRRLASSYDFQSFGASPVDPFAARVTRAAVKWIDLFEDSEEVINVFLGFAVDQIRYSAGEEQTARVIVEKDIGRLLVWNQKARAALLTLRQMRAQVYVTQSYERIQGVVISRIFNDSMTLTSAQVEDLVANLDSRTAVEELLGKMATLLSTVEALPDINRLLEIAVGLNKRAGQVEDRAVADAMAAPASQFCAEILLRIASIGVVPDLAFGRRIPAVLGVIQAGTVAAKLAGLQVSLIKEEQAEFFFDLVNELVARCESLGLRQEAAALAPLIPKLAPLLVFSPSAFEGTYDVTVGTKVGHLTLLDSGNGELMMGFNLDAARVRHDREPKGSTGARVVSFSVFSIVFNKERRLFIGAHRTPRGSLYPTGPSANMLVEFSLRIDNGKPWINGRLSVGGGDWLDFEGVRVEPATQAKQDAEISNAPSGTYRCRGTDTLCAFDMVNLNPFFSGNLMIDDRYLTIHLPYGFYDTRRRLLFMNSAELGSGMFVQLRGWFSEGGKYLHATCVVSGTGKTRSLEMERVDASSGTNQG